jgi:hypothetical protein
MLDHRAGWHGVLRSMNEGKLNANDLYRVRRYRLHPSRSPGSGGGALSLSDSGSTVSIEWQSGDEGSCEMCTRPGEWLVAKTPGYAYRGFGHRPSSRSDSDDDYRRIHRAKKYSRRADGSLKRRGESPVAQSESSVSDEMSPSGSSISSDSSSTASGIRRWKQLRLNQ